MHALVTRDGWTNSGEWIPVPYVDERAAEELFRHRVLSLLRRRGLLGPERIELLRSLRRRGFSVHNRVFAHPQDRREFEALVRYMMRSPISLSRLRFTPDAKEVVYTRKAGDNAAELVGAERIDAITASGSWDDSTRSARASTRSPSRGSCATCGGRDLRAGPGAVHLEIA